MISVYKSVKEMVSRQSDKVSSETGFKKPVQEINYATLHRKQKETKQVDDDTYGLFYSMQTLCFNRILGHKGEMSRNADLITVN